MVYRQGLFNCSSDTGALGTATVNGGGAAVLSSGILSVGSHTITCSYSPTGLFDPSSGNGSLTVNKATPTVTVSFSPEPSYPGDVVAISATVSGVSTAQPTGTVTFVVDGVSAGTAALTSGVAVLSHEFTSVANHTVVATYSGDGNYVSVSGTGTHSVVKLPTTSTVTATPNPAIGTIQSVTIQSVTTFPDVQLGSANQRLPLTGTVQFFDGGVLIGNATIDGTTELAVITVPSLTVGTHSFTASYSGDPNYLPSASVNGAFTLTAVAPVSGLSVFGNTDTNVNASVSYSAMVVNPLNQPQPSGTVTWSLDGLALGTSQVSANGTTSFSTTFPAPGTYSLVATFAGQNEPGSITFAQNVLSTTSDGSAPFVMSSPSTTAMGTDGSAALSISLASGGVSTPITLTCSGAPAGYTCNLAPATITLAAGAAPSNVAVSVVPTAPATTTQAQNRTTSKIALAGLGAGFLFAFGLRKRLRMSALASIVCLISVLFGLNGCGTTKQYASNAPQSYSLTVSARVDSYQEKVLVSVTR